MEDVIELTKEEADILRSAVRIAWEYVGADYLSECGGTIRRAEVIEVACDADRPLTVVTQGRHFGKNTTVTLGGKTMPLQDYEKLYRDKFLPFLIQMNRKETEKFFAPVFPFKRYGL